MEYWRPLSTCYTAKALPSHKSSLAPLPCWLLGWPSPCLKQSTDLFQTEWRMLRTGIGGTKIAVKQPLCLPIPPFVGVAVNVLAPGGLVPLLFSDTFIWLSSSRDSPQGPRDIPQSFSSSKEQELQHLATQADRRVWQDLCSHYSRPRSAMLLKSTSCEIFWCRHMLYSMIKKRAVTQDFKQLFSAVWTRQRDQSWHLMCGSLYCEN